MFDLEQLCKNAKSASEEIASLSEEKVVSALKKAAALLRENRESLKNENAVDIVNAEKKGKSARFIDRLRLTDAVIDGMADGLEEVANLKSPAGEILYEYENQKQGIKIVKKAVPFGVIGIIYESRPNVTADAFALCFKTGNAVILKGGSDALNSNLAIEKVLRDALETCGVTPFAVSVIPDASRETTARFMKMKQYVDLLIPRGSAALIKATVENSEIPIIETGAGNCHVYIDEFADGKKAADIIFNAKTQRYSVCNACESIVVHKNALGILPEVAKRLAEKQVEMRCDERSYDVLKDYPFLKRAEEEDFYAEYGDAIISVKTVDCISDAIKHINTHGTHHSESIVTENSDNAELFMRLVDSSTVYHNASTRFTDGFVFGLGAEIGISTQKLHARGPMGLNALVTTKYFVKGDGAVRK